MLIFKPNCQANMQVPVESNKKVETIKNQHVKLKLVFSFPPVVTGRTGGEGSFAKNLQLSEWKTEKQLKTWKTNFKA